jgi:hypothetical protein
MVKYKQQEYQSIEMKIADSLKPAGNFFHDAIQCFYGAIASPFRIPTFIRKLTNEQIPYWKTKSVNLVQTGGSAVGCFVDILGFSSVYLETKEGNYIPLAVLVGTNLLSGIYELGRLSKSQEEYKALKSKLEDHVLV